MCEALKAAENRFRYNKNIFTLPRAAEDIEMVFIRFSSLD